MNTNTIDAKLLSKMFLAGAKNLEAKKEWINELNVFPVPDGDTGTNMTLTIMSAANEVAQIENASMEMLAKAISSGSLRGARGNSGVILSQLLRGFTKTVAREKTLTAQTIASAMEKGVETAYKAVMKPKEGTILTVAREAASKAVELAEDCDNLQEFFEDIFSHAQDTLEKTPEMLPVLKEAGVVDSGGQGLLEVYRGALDAFMGKDVDYSVEVTPSASAAGISAPGPASTDDIKFGYCTEFIILLEKPMADEEEVSFKEFLTSIGDSIVVVADDEIVKVHVHTNHPGQAFEKALTYGQLSRMKIDNMREEHQEKLIKDAEKLAAQQKAEEEAALPNKEIGFISVATGDGIADIFKELGCDYLIEGGQTMNPSTEDMLNAISKVRADHVFIFPNNKNIILAANQAKALTRDKNIIVIPTTTIPQGISALINYMPDKTAQENQEMMMDIITTVKTVQITYAVRDTHIEDKEIHEHDIMGISDKGILAVGGDVAQVAMDSLVMMADDDSELISIYYGEDVSEEEAQTLLKQVEEDYPDCDVELNFGGQPIYYYILSVE